jgi:hypothetical protein
MNHGNKCRRKNRAGGDTGGSGRPSPRKLVHRFKGKEMIMETQFIYFNEDAKYRIVSSIFVLAIILLVILSGLDKNGSADLADFEYGKIRHYSKILGVNSAHDSWSRNEFLTYGHKFNISFNGNVVFAANSE